MEVKLAKTAGFCFGVKRAVDKVYEGINGDGRIYTFGPIIHNEEVVRDLEEKGVIVVNDTEELKNLPKGTVIIRSHGISRKIHEEIDDAGFKVEDATCPFVLKIHKIVDEQSSLGHPVIIIGNEGHPEVEGIRGWCDTDTAPAFIIGSVEEAEAFEADFGEKEVCVVSQTTFNVNKFKDIVEIFVKKGYNVNVVNTICNATQERQREAREIASQSDVMIVIGSKSSSNSRKLYEICREECGDTHFIQTLDDLVLELPETIQCVGITAGASTPEKIIEEVQKYVRTVF
ncbi:MAG: 4-hydroxy-3-methylbut-2-enyl diphosphate reductase [Lachnospiraceae bacterium]|nr:4-hydroxy-3-methylbut-2-enyl diphosphate reductase [Lachnospiraceae bacterium]